METQLIHANLEILYEILSAMADVHSKSHADVRYTCSMMYTIYN